MASAVLNGEVSSSTANPANTLELLQRLQQAIISGHHQIAAMVATKLAKMKANCTVTMKSPGMASTSVAAVEPKRVQVQRDMTISDLEVQIYQKYKVPIDHCLVLLETTLPTRERADSTVHVAVLQENMVVSEEDDVVVVENENVVVVVDEDDVRRENVNDAVLQENMVVLEDDVVIVENENVVVVVGDENDVGRENGVAVRVANVALVDTDVAARVTNGALGNADVAARVRIGALGDADAAARVTNGVVMEENVTVDLTEPTNVNIAEEWNCSKCTLINKSVDRICTVCGNNRTPILNSDTISVRSGSSLAAEVNASKNYSNYLELLDMENTDLISTLDAFECTICLTIHHPDEGVGVTLKECLHSFCRDCLAQLIETSTNAEIRCPYVDEYTCNRILEDREIRALVSAEVYDRYLTLSVNEAESKIENTFHCRTANCVGWCVFENGVDVFVCPVCQQRNCLPCQAIHAGINCQQYQRKIQIESANDPEAKKTRLYMENMLEKGEAMTCPKCHVIIMKYTGCDGVVCIICKTALCWATKGARWGPRGLGDTSGGCGGCTGRRKCHPQCSGCH